MSASKMYSTYRPKERNWPAFANAKPLRLPMGEKLQNWLQSGTVFNVTLYLSAALFVALVLLVPLYLFIRTGTAWAKAVETLLRPATLQVLGNTVLLSVSVTLGATVLALPLAWLTTRTDLPGRRLWAVLHALPLVIPSYIYAFLFLSFLSPKGLLQQMLQRPFNIERLPPIYGFTGAFIVLTLISYPYIFLTVQAALRQMDWTLLEVAQTNGATKWQITRHVLLPYLWPSLTAGGLLVMLYTLRDFGAVSLLQFSTFTRVIYNRYQGFQLDEAATMASVLVLMTGIIMLFESRFRAETAALADEEICDSSRPRQMALGRGRWAALGFTSLVSFFALIMPVGILVYWLVRGLRHDLLNGMVGLVQQNSISLLELLAPAQLSVTTGLLTAVFAVLIAIPITILSVRHQSRWAKLLTTLSYGGYALPGIVVALAFVFAGINFLRPFYQTLPLLLAAYMVLFVPQAVSAGRGVLARLPVELEEVGYSLGGSRWAILRYVILPLIRPGLLAGGLLVFLTVMKELPATLLLSPLGSRTLPMLVWSNISEAFFARAAAPTLLLLLLSSVPLAWFSLRKG
ncbi:MAG: iron ABC transporter permease [Chloroflexota bacterium]